MSETNLPLKTLRNNTEIISIIFLRSMYEWVKGATKPMPKSQVFLRVSVLANFTSAGLTMAILPCKVNILCILTPLCHEVPQYSFCWLSFTIQKPSLLHLCSLVRENFWSLFSSKTLLLLGQSDNKISLRLFSSLIYRTNNSEQSRIYLCIIISFICSQGTKIVVWSTFFESLFSEVELFPWVTAPWKSEVK